MGLEKGGKLPWCCVCLSRLAQPGRVAGFRCVFRIKLNSRMNYAVERRFRLVSQLPDGSTDACRMSAHFLTVGYSLIDREQVLSRRRNRPIL